MQVVQPYPTTLKPSCSSGASRPAAFRYSVTAREPGPIEVFTCAAGFKPAAAAFFASRPAASITPGLEVLVQEVMAAMTTSPWFRPGGERREAGGGTCLP